MNSPGRGKLVTAAAAIAAVLLTALAAPALAKDRNKDQLPDSWEKRNHLSLKVKQTKRDPDRDKLANKLEYKYKTNPLKADTDNDGLKDGFEVKIGYDPTDPDSDGDDIPDGQEDIGYIASFSGTTLTVNLSRGGTVSGLIDEDTYIACDRQSDDEDLDGECLTSDLKPGVLVSDIEFDEDQPNLIDEVDLVGVY